MAQYEGCVTHVDAQGRATVLITPGNPGILGAPNLNVCHAAADSSAVPIDALNRAEAAVGDRVVVYRETAGLLRNAVILLGVPVVGLFGGLIFARFTGMDAVGLWAGAGMGFLLGLMFGVVRFKGSDRDGGARITRILERGDGCCPEDNVREKAQPPSTRCEMCQQGRLR